MFEISLLQSIFVTKRVINIAIEVKVYSLQSIEALPEYTEGWEFWNCGGYASLPTLAAQIYKEVFIQNLFFH